MNSFTMVDFSTAKDTRYATVRVAEGGRGKDSANFFTLVFWHQVDTILEQFKKGKQIAVTGELRYQEWGEGDERKSKIELVARDFELLGGGTPSGVANGNGQPVAAGVADDDSPV